MMGPFCTIRSNGFEPIQLWFDPRKEANKFRVILDLSYPEKQSVNSHIPRFVYDGGAYKLKLPSAEELISKFGKKCYLFKLDLQRAYRQLPCDHFDWALLGNCWEGHVLVDKSIPFGLRHGAMNCERVISAICHADFKYENGGLH